MTRTLALSSILAVSLLSIACGDRAVDKVTVAADLALTSTHCQWWYKNADPAPLPQRERFLKCTIAGQVVRVDTSGVGQNGGE